MKKITFEFKNDQTGNTREIVVLANHIGNRTMFDKPITILPNETLMLVSEEDIAEILSGLRPDAVIIDDFVPLEQHVIQQLFERDIRTLDIVESFNKHRPDRPYGKKHRRKFK